MRSLSSVLHLGVLSFGLVFSVIASAADEQQLVESINVYRSQVQRCACLLYTSPSPRDGLLSRMPSSA